MATVDTQSETTVETYRKPKTVNLYKTHYRLAYVANTELFVRGFDHRLPERTEPVAAYALIGQLKAMPVAETRPADLDALIKLYGEAGETAPPVEQLRDAYPMRDVFHDEAQRLRNIVRTANRDAARERGAAAAAGILAALGATVPSVEL